MVTLYRKAQMKSSLLHSHHDQHQAAKASQWMDHEYRAVTSQSDDLPYITVRPKTKNNKKVLRMRSSWD